MKKRRVTLNIDEDVLETLESVDGRSLSDTANRALRAAAAAIAHRRALTAWLDELDAVDGGPTDEDYAAADRLLDEVFGSSADSFAA
jgi:hypothetical protein